MEDIIKGPRTSNAEFLAKHLNTNTPGLEKVKTFMDAGDIKAAEKIFADYVRGFLQPQKLNRGWFSPVSEEYKANLKERATDIMDYKFKSCGIPYHFADHKIDWYFNPTYNGYKEWPWQLSRHPELTALAEYYTYTGDEAAAKTWVDMIDSWFEQAVVPPDGTGGGATVCWRTIEAGIRMHGWSKQLHAFINSPALSDEFITRYFVSIYEHGHRLRIAHCTGNWLLMEMHGLIRISILYPFLNDSPEWNEYSVKKLEAELDVQVYPDGFQYELSTTYHAVVDGNYFSILWIYHDMELEPPKFLKTKLEKLYEMYPHLTRPDRRLPDINDGSQYAILGRMRDAYRLYPYREDYRWFATEGKEGKAPDYLSYAFPYAGAVAMRTSWDTDAVWGYMDCSPFGRGHQHEDKLNVLIFAYGKNLLTEGGIYDYDSSEMRKYVLDTRAHNTIRINSMSQNQRKCYTWDASDINKKAELEFSATPALDIASSKFTAGYGPEFDKTVHSRKLMFFKDIAGTTPFFAVIDRLEAPDDAERTYESQWHYEDCQFTLDGLYASGDFGDGIGLTAVFSDENAKIVDMIGQYEPYYQGWFPIRPSGPHEHRKIHTPVLCGSFKNSRRIVSILYPYKDGANIVASVRADSDISAKEFTIVLKDGSEIKLSE